MANQLKMAMIEAIVRLRERRWSIRRISRELGVDRETVSRHLALIGEGSKPAKAPSGSEAGVGESKPAKAPPGSTDDSDVAQVCSVLRSEAIEDPLFAAPPGRHGGLSTDTRNASANTPAMGDVPGPVETREELGPLAAAGCGRSTCEPWRPVIATKLELGLSARRIYQDLCGEEGFTASYYSVRRFVARLSETRELPFRRLECAPGVEAQVDFGTGIAIVGPDAKRRRTHVFRIVLSHSRKAYSVAVYRQTTEEFIRSLEDAFWHFGGVPQTLVIDNLRAAVQKADWFEPELNPKVRSFCEHYGVVILPTKPYTPRHKGKVERGIDYVQENGLRGHRFKSLEEENIHLLEWEKSVADTRIHGTTRRQVGKTFQEVERAALHPLPRERFPFFHESQRSVHRDGHVEVDKAYYSVPPEYLGHDVWVRWDGRLVRIFSRQMQQIAVHVKHEPGRFSTQGLHIASEKISGTERGAAWLLTKTRRIGAETNRWAESMVQARGVEGLRVLQGLLSLANRHPGEAIEQACAIAASHGSYQLRTIRALIERQGAKQDGFEFLKEHPLIRSLREYEELVHNSFQKEQRR